LLHQRRRFGEHEDGTFSQCGWLQPSENTITNQFFGHRFYGARHGCRGSGSG
jgi:hypothetical protein